jgi:hypothetical protein
MQEARMDKLDTKPLAAAGRPAQRKQPYFRPQLQELGRLHLQTQGTGPNNGDAGQNMMTPGGGGMGPSDRRLKEHVVRVGQHPAGFDLYLFDYKPEFQDAFGTGRRWGVMADEVEPVIPEAVHVGADGYKRVDYSMLGMELALH